MPLTWTSALSVGIEDLDEQHQEIFRRAERLICALRAGDRGEVLPLLTYLDEYVVHHFDAEERLMKNLRYPGLDRHAAAHRAFREEFAGMVRDFERVGATALVALTIHNWLSDWLRKHIAGVDVDLGRFVASTAR
ncbi:MAG TPA: bacteriohemerythrin [Anaeromyxobacter sp.]